MTISKMEVGLAGNIDVALEVMEYEYLYIDAYREHRYVDPEGNTYHAEDLPKFTEDIDAALRVLAKMREKGYNWTATDAISWSFYAPGEVEPVTATAKTMPLAIGYAALLAVMGGKQ